MKIHLILLIGLMLVGCAKFKIESLEQDGVFNISATGFNKSQAEARWYDGANKACKFGKYDGYPGNHKTNTTQSGGSVSFVGSITNLYSGRYVYRNISRWSCALSLMHKRIS